MFHAEHFVAKYDSGADTNRAIAVAYIVIAQKTNTMMGKGTRTGAAFFGTRPVSAACSGAGVLTCIGS